MDHFEMVEKLREKAKVSYEEAKAALEACDWDVLDALVLLESEGKVNEERTANFSTEEKKDAPKAAAHSKHVDGKQVAKSIGNAVNKANTNYFVIKRHGEELMRLPLTVTILLLVFTFYFSIVALIIGLFCGLRYSFEGSFFSKPTMNNVMDKAADVAENIKQEVKQGAEERK